MPSKQTTVLVAGATGHLGRHVVRELAERGYRVRAFGRAAERLAPLHRWTAETAIGDLRTGAGLDAAVRGADVVLSCAGATMSAAGLLDRASFREVDLGGNLRLLAAARAAGVGRFVYVSLWGGRQMRRTEYADAHEGVVDALGASGLSHAVVRPTGYFSFFDAVLDAARRGVGPVLGAGDVRTNPIHEGDLAAVCADAITSSETDIGAGGPVTYTRREIVELAFAALGRRPRLLHAPTRLFRGIARAMKLVNPRIAALLDFGAAVSESDCVAPVRGTRDLASYFESRAGAPAVGARVGQLGQLL